MNRSTKQIIYYAYILQYNLKKKKKLMENLTQNSYKLHI